MVGKYQRYPEYKNSGFYAVQRIPISWKASKVRFQFTFGKGLTITKENLRDTGLPCVNYGEVHSRFGFEVSTEKHSLKCVDESYLRTNKSSRLEVGDLVFADTSEDIEGAGNFTQLVYGKDVFAGYHTIIARPLNRKASRFWAYLFDSLEFRNQIRTSVKGVKVFSVTQAILRSMNVWLPPLEERLAIANFLDHETDKIDALIAKQEKLIELLKEKRQAVISHAVTKGLNPDVPMKDSGIEWLGEVPEHWTVGRFKNCTSRIIVGVAEAATHAYTSHGVPIIRSTNIKESGLETDNLLFLKPEFAKNLASKAIMGKDIVTVRTGYPGISSVVPDELEGSQCFTNLISTPKHHLFSSEFLVSLLNSRPCKEYFSLEGWGSAQKNISVPILEQLPVSWPNLSEQLEIVNYVQEMSLKFEKLITRTLESIVLMKERRSSLISAAVTGKIDVRNWQPASKESTYA
ncbi:restriction modification system DNA specificity domain-containing protein [Tenacibaculum sp. KUL152]|nr:restriction modification system DNA specificity domain-containing protein [Tenacibaculum sp. KUL152]